MKQIDIPLTMTSKGTFTLPARVRKDFGLHAKGDRIMLTYRPGSRTAELKAPMDVRSMQDRVDGLIPADIPPLADVREYLTNAKLSRYHEGS
jgi:bifunctional DNA-binding transcriptional regulator/antitoxin component of YhaV-PrlF toxin-antitoxin module